VQDPTEPLLGADHLPLEYEQKHILLNGTWRCKWTARDRNGDLKDYSFETITIHDVDMSTGIIEGTGTNVYDGGAGYKIYGRLSRRGYAHFYYTSPGRHAEKSGMVILKFDFQQEEAEGWWLGGLRGEGTPISGRVTWTEDANVDEWADALCDFEYYPGVGPSEDREDASPETPQT
jgi:hypothetical protein